MAHFSNKEFNEIINNYIIHPKFQQMKRFRHHGHSRYDHSLRVAYYTYKVTKALHLNYKQATVAALLHDFFLDEVITEASINRMRHHPKYASINASKYFDIDYKQKSMIETHMFPVTIKPPIYIEGWLLDMVDDGVAIYEKVTSYQKGKMPIPKKRLNPLASMFILFLTLFK